MMLQDHLTVFKTCTYNK